MSSPKRVRNSVIRQEHNARTLWTRRTRMLSKSPPDDPTNYMMFHFGFYEPPVAIDASVDISVGRKTRSSTTAGFNTSDERLGRGVSLSVAGALE